MILCIAIDDNMGILFNNRRQSKDKELRKYLLNEIANNRLWISSYTATQFENPLPNNIIVDDDFLNKAKENDYCFIEKGLNIKQIEKAKKIIFFKWNRVYPADVYFDSSLLDNGWRLLVINNFKGNSHEQITKEEWLNENF